MTVIENLTQVKKNIAKLEKQFKNGKVGYNGFTIDIFYGGNKQVDINRVSVGGVGSPEDTGQKLYDLTMECLKGNLKFWEDAAKRDIQELYKALENNY